MRISDWSSDVCSSDLKIVGEPRAEQRQRMAEGGAAVIFVGVARHAEVGVIAILLAPACVIAGGEDMAVRRRTEPRVLISRGQRDRVETVDFIAVADDLALGIAIPPAGARTLGADPGEAE